MRDSFIEGTARQRVGEEKSVEVQISFGLSLEDVREGLFSLCVSAGRQVLPAMMEQVDGSAGAPLRDRAVHSGVATPDASTVTE